MRAERAVAEMLSLDPGVFQLPLPARRSAADGWLGIQVVVDTTPPG